MVGASTEAREICAASPLLPPRIVLDRNRGGSSLAILIQGAGIFGIFLFLTYDVEQTLGFSAVVTGVASLPMVAMIALTANLAIIIVLLPRVGPKPLVTLGMLLATGGMVWLTRIGMHSTYAAAVLGPLLVTGAGFGFTIATAINTGTFGLAPQDAGVASATVNTGQQIGGSIGTSPLNTIFASAVASYITPGALVHGRPGPQLIGLALVHRYTTAFWWSAAIFASGAVICGTLLRRSPLTQAAVPQGAAAARHHPRLPTSRPAYISDRPPGRPPLGWLAARQLTSLAARAGARQPLPARARRARRGQPLDRRRDRRPPGGFRARSRSTSRRWPNCSGRA